MNRQDAKDAKEIESLEKVVLGLRPLGMNWKSRLDQLEPVRKGTLHHALPPGNSCRSVRSARSWSKFRNRDRSLPWLAPDPHGPPHTSLFTAELCQHRNNSVAASGFSCPNPITRSFDTDSDTDPDPELALPLDFSDNLKLGPETDPYTYTAKRYTFTYTMMR